MRIASTGNLTLDRLRHDADALHLVGFAALHAREVAGPGHACRCVEPRAIEDACEVSCRPSEPCDEDAARVVLPPTPGVSSASGEGLGELAPLPDAIPAAGEPHANPPGLSADTGVGSALDVFA